ncbi:hypothetical protein ANN_13746 [Periplaneta americana]|uniref:Uncharacterized protein n=1 Tax=Periplaneta americana TaxID=6978 RepID=A0ABQ8SVC7_PERAM|nr:hypothetical protein ANN_13746 [Periplaneta americana]
MSPGSSTESYPAFAHIGLRENPGKNLNQVTCPNRESNPGHLVSRADVLTVTPQGFKAHLTWWIAWVVLRPGNRLENIKSDGEKIGGRQCYIRIVTRSDRNRGPSGNGVSSDKRDTMLMARAQQTQKLSLSHQVRHCEREKSKCLRTDPHPKSKFRGVVLRNSKEAIIPPRSEVMLLGRVNGNATREGYKPGKKHQNADALSRIHQVPFVKIDKMESQTVRNLQIAEPQYAQWFNDTNQFTLDGNWVLFRIQDDREPFDDQDDDIYPTENNTESMYTHYCENDEGPLGTESNREPQGEGIIRETSGTATENAWASEDERDRVGRDEDFESEDEIPLASWKARSHDPL